VFGIGKGIEESVYVTSGLGEIWVCSDSVAVLLAEDWVADRWWWCRQVVVLSTRKRSKITLKYKQAKMLSYTECKRLITL
jgi:hypothetical protein